MRLYDGPSVANISQDDTFEAEFEPSDGLNASEVIWVMDQLLCLEVSWLDGYPLSQTIYTSLHIDRLLSPDKVHKDTFYFGSKPPPLLTERDALVHKVLRAYCIALIKSCQLILYLIQSQNFYEEEDFVTHLFGRELLPEVGSIAAKNRLAEAISWISESSLPESVRYALTARCRFRLALLQTLGEDARRWEGLIEYIGTITESHGAAKSCPAAFSEKVQRQLATSTPPRLMIQVSRLEICAFRQKVQGSC